MSILTDSPRVARKLHTCGLCGGRIDPGTAYERRTWVDGGDFVTTKAHSFCLDLANWWTTQQWHDDHPGREEHEEALGLVVQILCSLLTPQISPCVAAERPPDPIRGESITTRARVASGGMQ